jgi:hypothetical protein
MGIKDIVLSLIILTVVVCFALEAFRLNCDTYIAFQKRRIIMLKEKENQNTNDKWYRKNPSRIIDSYYYEFDKKDKSIKYLKQIGTDRIALTFKNNELVYDN